MVDKTSIDSQKHIKFTFSIYIRAIQLVYCFMTNRKIWQHIHLTDILHCIKQIWQTNKRKIIS